MNLINLERKGNFNYSPCKLFLGQRFDSDYFVLVLKFPIFLSTMSCYNPILSTISDPMLTHFNPNHRFAMNIFFHVVSFMFLFPRSQSS